MAYYGCADIQLGDLVVVACNHGAALAVGLGWPGARVLLRSGCDGADLPVLDVIANEAIGDRFACLVLGSGDGCFAQALARLGQMGLDVTVISNRRALSRRLQLAARHVVLFDAGVPPAASAALAQEVA
jgi:hypothetical protein